MCAGHVIFFYSKKIRRICRSSIAAERIALANVIDYTMWIRSLAVELYDGSFYHKLIQPMDGLSVISPFAHSPETRESNAAPHDILGEPVGNKKYLINGESTRSVSLASYCSKCRESSSMECEDIREGYES